MEGEQLFVNSSSNGFFNPNWETPMDQTDPFGSALSSIVSSPAGSNAGAGDGFMIRELIGKLGSICDSGEISPQSCINPLNSPPKLSLSSLAEAQLRANFPGLAPLNADPARVSNFVPRNLVGSGGARFGPELGDSREGSSVSEQNPGVDLGSKALSHTNSRKRKAKTPVKEEKVEREKEESTNAKRSKPDEEQSAKAAEPQKDYIHVRARRGQATDSHSLAERVRREKISERMKFLQDLVPGCNKVTGKAVVLDEIINYVQSLQRQVEFLSMKLSTVNPRVDFNMEALLPKDILPLEYSAPVTPYGYQSQQIPTLPNGLQLPLADGFDGSSSQIPAYWEDDLHSIVQMGFPQSEKQSFQGVSPATQTKVEL